MKLTISVATVLAMAASAALAATETHSENASPHPFTNAERLSKGLPLNPPSWKRHGRVGRRNGPSALPKPFATSTTPATPEPSAAPKPSAAPEPSAAPSVPQTVTEGYITCHEPNGSFHTVGARVNGDGQYTSSEKDSLLVGLDLAAASRGPVDIVVKSGPLRSAYPYFGAINGFVSTDTNMGPDSFNYAFFGGTEKTEPGVPAVPGSNSISDASGREDAAIQSAIWRYDNDTGYLTPEWVNTDGTVPEVYVFYMPESDAFAMTGDPADFVHKFDTFTAHGKIRQCRLAFSSVIDIPV